EPVPRLARVHTFLEGKHLQPASATVPRSLPYSPEVSLMKNRIASQVRWQVWATAACLTLPLPGIGAAAAEPDWKVGLAQTCITPEQPVALAGYAARTKPFEKVTADLYVKAMVLEDREGQRGVIVTSDLIGFPAAVAEPICARIQE